MTSREVEKHIQQGTLRSVYLLHGDEEYLIDELLGKLLSAGLGEGDPSFNTTIYLGSECDPREVSATCLAFPFMSERRVVVVREADKVAGREPLSDYLQNPQDSTLLLLVLSAPAPRAKKKVATKRKGSSFDFFSYLKNHPSGDLTVECKRLSEPVAVTWIRNRFRDHQRSIGEEAAALIPAIKGTALREIDQEIEKILLSLPDVKEFSRAQIHEYFTSTRKFTLYDLTNAVMAGDRMLSLRIAESGFDEDGILGLISHLANQYIVLWRIWKSPVRGRATDEDARAAGLGFAWQYEQLRPLLTRISGSQYFQNRFEALLAADSAIKSGRDRSVTLTILLHELTQ